MNKKFELTSEFKTLANGTKVFRIKALVSFGDVNAGDLGGFVEKEDNLSHSGDAWVYGDAEVFGDAKVSGNASVCGDAKVSGNASVCGDAEVYGDAWVYGDAKVYGNASVCGDAKVSGNASVCGDAKVSGNADYTTIKGFGTCLRTTTFFRCTDKKVRVSCGCFYGTIPEFRERVKKTREGKIAEEYLMIADLMEFHFSEKKKQKRVKKNSIHINEIKRLLQDVDAIDAVPVVHGFNDNRNYHEVDEFRCSECGLHLEDWVRHVYDEELDEEFIKEYTFKHCPECGAKMDGGTDGV